MSTKMLSPLLMFSMLVVVAVPTSLAQTSDTSQTAKSTEAETPEGSTKSEDVPQRDERGFHPIGEITADYSTRRVAGENYNSFEIRRAELGVLRRGRHRFGGELLVEAIRSAGTDSFAGIDGDSLVMRIKRAWGYGRHELGPVTLEGRLGLIYSPWIDVYELESQIRHLDALAAERLGIYQSADLGASALMWAFERRVMLQVALLNGEGRNQVEQNNGKNVQAVLSFTPVQASLAGEPWRLRVHLGGQEGSLGPSAVRAHRLSAGLTSLHPRLSLGAEFHRAYGLGAVSSRKSEVLGLWMRGHYKSFSSILRYDRQRQDLDREDTGTQLFLGGVFAQKQTQDSLFRLGIAARHERAQANASVIPGYADAAKVTSVLLIFAASIGTLPQDVAPQGRLL